MEKIKIAIVGGGISGKYK